MASERSHGPLVFTAKYEPVILEDMYHGRSVFLICGGPSFAELDSSLLRRPGIVTMCVNNSVKTFRPNLWTCVDNPDHFLRSIWHDPTILKFAPIKQINARVFDSDRWEYQRIKISQCPSTFFYHRNAEFKAERFLTEPTINWGNSETNGGGRSVMLVAMRLLYYLGFRRIFLLGCDFKMAESYAYHFDQKRQNGSVNGNNKTYGALKQRFQQLRPIFEAAGLQVYNCNLNSGLDAFDKIPYSQALELVAAEWGNIDVKAERTAGLYDEPKPPLPSAPVTQNNFWRKEPVLPRIAHFVWLDGPLSVVADRSIKRFKELHPEWDVRVWTEVPVEMESDMRLCLGKIKSVRNRALLLRLWLVWIHGGMSFSADMFFVRNLDELRNYENFAVYGGDFRIRTGAFGFLQGSPIIGQFFKGIRKKLAFDAKSGPASTFFEQEFKKSTKLFNVLPEHYFYIIRKPETAAEFLKLDANAQQRKLHDLRQRMTDDTHPFAVHTPAIRGSEPAGNPLPQVLAKNLNVPSKATPVSVAKTEGKRTDASMLPIPSVAHYVMLEGAPSVSAADAIERFRRLHPKWTIKVWSSVPNDIPADLKDLVDKTPVHSQKVDLIRLWVAFTQGGIVLAANVHVLRNFDNLRKSNNFFIRGGTFGLRCGVFGSKPDKEILGKALLKIRSLSKRDVESMVEPHLFGEKLLANLCNENGSSFTVLPEHYFYIIRTRKTAIAFGRMTAAEQTRKIATLRGRMTDGVEPYGVCLPEEARESIAKASKVHSPESKTRQSDKKEDGKKAGKERLILLTAPNFLGDEVVFSGAVRDLKMAGKGNVMLDVVTSNPSLWENNPHLSKFDRTDPKVEVIKKHYRPNFRKSGQRPTHFVEQYTRRLGRVLGIKSAVRRFGGDIHLSPEEMKSSAHPEIGAKKYWLIVSGCKANVPVKGWGRENYQAVVDSLIGKVTFVQIGSNHEEHPPLRNVLNFVGRTSFRDLVRLIYHSDGVLCPITAAMHLAAAVPLRPGAAKLRPCVVIAGGREDRHFISYPGHRVIDLIGSLSCCASGGCGKNRFKPGTGSRVCDFPVQIGGKQIAKCMSLITVRDVVAAIESYYLGGLLEFTTSVQS